MKVAVLGMGHMFDVMAECMERLGNEVTTKITSTYIPDAVWLCLDTPLVDNRGDVEQMKLWIGDILNRLSPGMLVIISCQMPVGTIRQLQEKWHMLRLVCIPENLRMVNGVQSFLEASRVVVGVFHESDFYRVAELLTHLKVPLISMSVESAELSKHALNAFLACEIAFINEISDLATRYKADINDVSKALMTDDRIGMKAYLKAGPPFSNGHLERELNYLRDLGCGQLLRSILDSNEARR